MTFKQLTLLSLALLLLLPALSSAQQRTCKALVLEGGGDKGAYEAGVFYGWINNAKNPEDFQYDVVTGISVGAINGLGIAQFPKGQEKQAAQFLIDGWRGTTQRDVLRQWPGGILQGLFFKPALFNTDPELHYLDERIFSPPNQRKAVVAATDFVTGEKVTWSEEDWTDNREMAVKAALFSSAVPVVFLYRNFNNKTYIDGGWSGEGMDIEDAVFRCREQVDRDEDITVDVIFANNISFANASSNKFNTMQMNSRYNAIKSYVGSTRAYMYSRDAFPKVNFRYVQMASERLPDQNIPLGFKKKSIEFMINLGIKDAKNTLAQGPGASAAKVAELAKVYQDDLYFNTDNFARMQH